MAVSAFEITKVDSTARQEYPYGKVQQIERVLILQSQSLLEELDYQHHLSQTFLQSIEITYEQEVLRCL